jgi:hypothetical protein
LRLTRKKQREAESFLQKLKEHAQTVRRTEEAEYYFSAFLSANRSVTFVLQKEHKDDYDAFFEPWRAALPDAERRLLAAMNKYRTSELKEGCQAEEVVWKFRPVTECTPQQLCGKVMWWGPPGTPPPQAGFPVRYIEIDGEKSEVLSVCDSYYSLVKRAVMDFLKQHPQHYMEYSEAERDYYPVAPDANS